MSILKNSVPDSSENAESQKAMPLPLEMTVPEEVFRSEVRRWAEIIGVVPHNVILRPMKRKWASCSSRGNLSFDIDLLHQPADFRRKAIVHELLHLVYPNHGPLFRALEKKYLQE